MSQKITEQELEALRTLQDTWNKLTKYLGELEYQKRGISKEITLVYEEFNKLEESRTTISKQIQDTFGTPGSVDLTTGEFKPE